MQTALNIASMVPHPVVSGVGTAGNIAMVIGGDQIESSVNAGAAEISRQVNYYMNNPIDFMSGMIGMPLRIHVPTR